MFFPFWGVPGPFYPFFLAMFFGYSGYSIYLLYREYRVTTSGKKRSQIFYIGLGTLIGFLGGSTNYFLWYSIPIPPYFNILVEVYILLTAYAIIKHNFLDIEVIIKKTIVFAGLFVAAYAIFASFAYLGTFVFENVIQSRWLAMAPSVLLIVIIFRPLENILKNITDRYLFQKKYDYRQLLRTFTDDVLTVLDLDKLVNLTVNKLVEIVKLDNAAILLHYENTEEYKIISSAGLGDAEYELPDSDPFIKYILKFKRYVLQQDINKEKPLDLDAQEVMRDLQAVIIIPLILREDMVGLLSLGKKKSDEEFTQDDIDILHPLARTLSIAIANAQLFEKLSEAQAQAAQREKMAVIGTLSAGINHEICNPLGIARGQCEMFILNLQEGLYDGRDPEELLEKAKEIMQKVINETDRATVITRKLSSFAKPARGNVEDDVQINRELEEVISLVEHDLKLDNINIVKDMPDGLPCISADRKQIQEIFFNIIRNAAQSIMGAGKITIRVHGDDKGVHVRISDTGIGIRKSDLNQIFNPFFTTKEPGKGTGLGLFIVKQIVERNNGHIQVQSEYGKGTTFYLDFKGVFNKRSGKKEKLSTG